MDRRRDAEVLVAEMRELRLVVCTERRDSERKMQRDAIVGAREKGRKMERMEGGKERRGEERTGSK